MHPRFGAAIPRAASVFKMDWSTVLERACRPYNAVSLVLGSAFLWTDLVRRLSRRDHRRHRPIGDRSSHEGLWQSSDYYHTERCQHGRGNHLRIR